MSNPWLSIPLEDYEGHMGADGVRQLAALAVLFQRALDLCRPKSVAILGIAGGNGLEHIDPAVTSRVVGIDINASYLEEVRRRFGERVELHCVDLAGGNLHVTPVDLVHAALIFEHTGLDRALDNAFTLITPGGKMSVVIQLPAGEELNVSPTPYTSMQKLKESFGVVDASRLRRRLAERGFRLEHEEDRALPGGKGFRLMLFA